MTVAAVAVAPVVAAAADGNNDNGDTRAQFLKQFLRELRRRVINYCSCFVYLGGWLGQVK